jgi:hypothetical protein
MNAAAYLTTARRQLVRASYTATDLHLDRNLAGYPGQQI